MEEEGKLRAKKVLTEECNNDNNLGKQAEEEQEGDMALWSTTRFSVSLSSRGQEEDLEGRKGSKINKEKIWFGDKRGLGGEGKIELNPGVY